MEECVSSFPPSARYNTVLVFRYIDNARETPVYVVLGMEGEEYDTK